MLVRTTSTGSVSVSDGGHGLGLFLGWSLGVSQSKVVRVYGHLCIDRRASNALMFCGCGDTAWPLTREKQESPRMPRNRAIKFWIFVAPPCVVPMAFGQRSELHQETQAQEPCPWTCTCEISDVWSWGSLALVLSLEKLGLMS